MDRNRSVDNGIDRPYFAHPSSLALLQQCPIAQLAERLTLDQEVPGSNPGRATLEKGSQITLGALFSFIMDRPSPIFPVDHHPCHPRSKMG